MGLTGFSIQSGKAGRMRSSIHRAEFSQYQEFVQCGLRFSEMHSRPLPDRRFQTDRRNLLSMASNLSAGLATPESIIYMRQHSTPACSATGFCHSQSSGHGFVLTNHLFHYTDGVSQSR